MRAPLFVVGLKNSLFWFVRPALEGFCHLSVHRSATVAVICVAMEQ